MLRNIVICTYLLGILQAPLKKKNNTLTKMCSSPDILVVKFVAFSLFALEKKKEKEY